MIKVGSDFSGVGAFNQALIRLGIEYKEIFACDMDKYARQTFIHNYGEPEYYPTNVYDRQIPSESLDIYMTSPPCQAFSLAGKRLGKDDKRGILFFNSHEFIQKNKPRYFIFENVKGLLSDDGGNTFQEWINMLGGKSVNGVPVIFPYEDSVHYHLYWQVLNAKHHGVPQNRERVFLIGIRDDSDNNFQFPREEQDEGFRWRQDGNSPAIMAMMRDTWKEKFTGQNPPIINKDYKIRRLTPRECFRLMDFPDTFTWPVSDSQAYKQAGNSIVVNVLYKIIKNLKL